MVWAVLIGVLVVVLLYILWQMDLLDKANKRLKQQMAAREQELLKLQQAAYQLAEQQKSVLLQQLQQVPAATVLSPVELKMCQLLVQTLPLLVKECCSKAITPQQVMKHQTQRLPDGAHLALMMKRHNRLTTLWQNNTMMSHLQLCTVAVALAQEETQAKAG
ncbi:MAG: hypothetical protein KKE30_13165 [Gammaproteobacteria bacterium]|nr:hypothetical protein [Gammaproteobacteria bacterium]MBU1556653.1 hypothetical protein [Gammaproteobacteria bacterium]MBU2070858.1 hypothetical protein [Gammaproteobacteria bacterium]MBU2185049.1 hypothetical protein [Gammaproteobacteria bacterium]MBU2204064.1 hypothetical protein [Gammaproteobacteria bacterium]